LIRQSSSQLSRSVQSWDVDVIRIGRSFVAWAWLGPDRESHIRRSYAEAFSSNFRIQICC
jgi:hypothetical protein